MATSNSVFISYRRDLGFAWARLVWEDLNDHGIDAFLDLESLREAGHFDSKVLHQIEGRPYFVPVLVHGSLERCTDPSDWLRREIEHAVGTERAIVPLVGPNFDFGEVDRCLPETAAAVLRSSNGVGLVAEYFAEAMTRLREERLQPIDLPVRTLSPADQQFAAEAQQRASRTGTAGRDAPADQDERRAEERTGPTPEPRRRRVATTRARGAVSIVAIAAVLGTGAFATAAVLDSGGTSSRSIPTDPPVTATGPAVTTTSTTTTEPPPTTSTPPSTLGSGRELLPGGTLRSRGGRHELTLTEQGQLLLTTDGVEALRLPEEAPRPDPDVAPDDATGAPRATWAAVMQRDGNFAVYQVGSDEPVWATGPRGDGAELNVVDDAGEGLLRVAGGGLDPWTCPGDCDEVDDGEVTDGGHDETDVGNTATTSSSSSSSSTSTSTTEGPDVPVVVPDVGGLPAEEARAILAGVGLAVGTDESFDADVPEGVVIRQSPAADEGAVVGDVVTITISRGPFPIPRDPIRPPGRAIDS